MVTDWIQAISSMLATIIAAIGIWFTIPRISKNLNKSADERMDKFEKQMKEHIRGYSDEAALDMWKRLIELYSNNENMREYSKFEENTEKK